MPSFFFFFFNDTATTEIYTLSLHDALPIWHRFFGGAPRSGPGGRGGRGSQGLDGHHGRGRPRLERADARDQAVERSEEHTSELQSQSNLVCRLLLEKKKKQAACRAHARQRV